MNEIYHLLRTLGIRGTYQGYHFLAYAIHLILEDESYLLLITKRLYPDIADHFNTTAYCVEHGLRTIVNSFWNKSDHALLEEIAYCTLSEKPTTAEFIDILAGYLQLKNFIEK